jgi:hypothetical protein
MLTFFEMLIVAIYYMQITFISKRHFALMSPPQQQTSEFPILKLQLKPLPLLILH